MLASRGVAALHVRMPGGHSVAFIICRASRRHDLRTALVLDDLNYLTEQKATARDLFSHRVRVTPKLARRPRVK